jgi:hypothetical protein
VTEKNMNKNELSNEKPIHVIRKRDAVPNSRGFVTTPMCVELKMRPTTTPEPIRRPEGRNEPPE